MVRREVVRGPSGLVRRPTTICCASPAGASPVPVGVGAPGSRPRTSKGDLRLQAGCQEPARRWKPRNREQTRGPQREVKPAASTNLQPGGRADHVAAKATWGARVPKLAAYSGGVRGAARVSGEERNTRDPSARPASWQGDSYKPKAKVNTAQRESEGIVVLHNPERSGGRTP
jgi:hypothetical protein